MFVVHSDSTFVAQGSHSLTSCTLAQVSILTLTEVRLEIPNPFMSCLILIEPLCLYKHPFSLRVNNLIHFYEWFKKIMDVRKVFDEMPERTFISWNSIMTACVGSLSLGDGIEYVFGCGVVGLSLMRLPWLCCY